MRVPLPLATGCFALLVAAFPPTTSAFQEQAHAPQPPSSSPPSPPPFAPAGPSLHDQHATYANASRRVSAPPLNPALAVSMLGTSTSLRDQNCPPCPEPSCFNCLLPKFTCAQFGDCNEYDGMCTCPVGFGGQDCLSPLCGSPIEGNARRFPRNTTEDGQDQSCECDAGWHGLNCNVCDRDDACANFSLGGERLGNDGVCYKGGSTVRQTFQECDVTNKKITEMLPDRPPKVTFSCEREKSECNFQFWIGLKESFYCGLKDCKEKLERTAESNTTRHECQKVECSCVPGRMLCGESGSIDLGDFLKEEIKGPGTMTCRSGKDGKRTCRFEEPAMNGLISQVFGDEAIFLSCDSGECIHYSEEPGYKEPLPPPTSNFWVLFSISAALLVVVVAALLFWLAGRHYRVDGYGAVRLPEEEAAKLMADHVPATLHFDRLSYSLGRGGGGVGGGAGRGGGGGRTRILDGITGCVRPGEVMAIVGASGAGKTTFLDILSGRNKRGTVEGRVLVNGRSVRKREYLDVVGFVDQEDCLMPTLTVYETVLYSALLRLPRDMSIEAKKYRTLDCLEELGILGIKDSRIGDAATSAGGRRGISGGEKRRVSIACELVTSPSIIALDEPTSGLDAASALNVVESLVTLAKKYKRTVVFTIHQPRSNIVALFDRLVVLAAGRSVYSGPLPECIQHFERIGHPCPTGFNLGDHLIDLTADAVGAVRLDPTGGDSASSTHYPPGSSGRRGGAFRDEEDGPVARTREEGVAGSGRATTARAGSEDAGDAAAADTTELRTRPNSTVHITSTSSAAGHHGATTRSLAQSVREAFGTRRRHEGMGGGVADATPMTAKLSALVEAFERSGVEAATRKEIESFSTSGTGSATPVATSGGGVVATGEGAARANGGGGGANELPDIGDQDRTLRGYRKANLWTQFTILSGRAFKNLYRNPMLMMAHYVMSVVLALFCGVLYHDITNDIAGFQNRLGLFFFVLALFGFSTLTSLGVFASERALFVRERANGYYHPLTYLSAKLLCDILPLRIVPPFLLGGIVYWMVGLVPQVAEFWMFILTLVLFSLCASSVVLLISIVVRDAGVANLVGSLTMLFSLLFAGLLINRERMPSLLRPLTHLSFFHAAYEALIVNELRHLTLTERRYGIDISVPSATILSSFGFDAQAFWYPDIVTLVATFGVTTVVGGGWLWAFVREER